MRVTCPECNFSNEIPEDKIPANAQLATCPKCGIKFQFRELLPREQVEPEVEETPYRGEYEPQQYQKPAAYTEQQEYTEHPEYAEQQSYAEQQEYSEHPDYTEQQSYAGQNEPVTDELHAAEQQLNPEQDIESAHQYDDPDTNAQDFQEPVVRKRVKASDEENSDIWQRLDSMNPDAKDADSADTDQNAQSGQGQEVPFENLEKYGFFPGFFLTIKNVLLSPASFFKDMELAGFIKPLIFFILLAEFQEICNFLWATTGVDTSLTSDVGRMVNDSVIAESLKDGSASALFSLLLYPLMLAGLSFPLIGVTHILLMVFGAGDRGYQATFRATAYSYAPIILCVLPVVGDMIGAMVSLGISIIAYKNIHNTTYMRVVLSMLMPLVLLLVILGFYMNFSQPTI